MCHTSRGRNSRWPSSTVQGCEGTARGPQCLEGDRRRDVQSRPSPGSGQRNSLASVPWGHPAEAQPCSEGALGCFSGTSQARHLRTVLARTPKSNGLYPRLARSTAVPSQPRDEHRCLQSWAPPRRTSRVPCSHVSLMKHLCPPPRLYPAAPPARTLIPLPPWTFWRLHAGAGSSGEAPWPSALLAWRLSATPLHASGSLISACPLPSGDFSGHCHTAWPSV